MAKIAQHFDGETRELVLFSSGNLLCGLDIRQVQEINKNLEITRVHHAPPYVRGVLNLRGQLLTVIDLRKKLGLEMVDIDADMRIIVAKGGERIVGMLVDRVADIIEASVDEMEPPPSNIDAVPGSFFSAIYKMEMGLAAVLDLEQVLEK